MKSDYQKQIFPTKVRQASVGKGNVSHMIETSFKTQSYKAKHHLSCHDRYMFYFRDSTATCDSPRLVILDITPGIKYFNNLKIIKPAYSTSYNIASRAAQSNSRS